MAKETVRVNLRLSAEAAAELERRAPSVNKRGEYLSALIMQAAPPAPATDPQEALYAAIGRQMVGMTLSVFQALGKAPGQVLAEIAEGERAAVERVKAEGSPF